VADGSHGSILSTGWGVARIPGQKAGFEGADTREKNQCAGRRRRLIPSGQFLALGEMFIASLLCCRASCYGTNLRACAARKNFAAVHQHFRAHIKTDIFGS
jgi:hypothetical protein